MIGSFRWSCCIKNQRRESGQLARRLWFYWFSSADFNYYCSLNCYRQTAKEPAGIAFVKRCLCSMSLSQKCIKPHCWINNPIKISWYCDSRQFSLEKLLGLWCLLNGKLELLQWRETFLVVFLVKNFIYLKILFSFFLASSKPFLNA